MIGMTMVWFRAQGIFDLLNIFVHSSLVILLNDTLYNDNNVQCK